MAKVCKGRYTAEPEDGVVVFLIGMRINKPWKLLTWLPVFVAMPRMLARLQRRPEYGLLGARTYMGPNPVVIQYWRSIEDLERFARDADDPHLAAWRRYNRRIASSGDVGIYHETYVVQRDHTESVYVNMPAWGLAAATTHVPARAGRATALTGGATSEPVGP